MDSVVNKFNSGYGDGDGSGDGYGSVDGSGDIEGTLKEVEVGEVGEYTPEVPFGDEPNNMDEYDEM